MAKLVKKSLLLVLVMVCTTAGLCAYFARGLYYHSITVHQLLTENQQLKHAITNLTDEQQIGYAKVIRKTEQGGRLVTTIKFVETARDDRSKTILEKQYSIEGDIIHFDALIVKFGDKMVADGRRKALYLWRRVYGEKTAPQDGFAIEQPGAEPRRYADLLKALPLRHREMFWSEIWNLANDTEKLKEYDITAVYGNVVYSRLGEGLIYVFKITPTGQVFPEVVPDI